MIFENNLVTYEAFGATGDGVTDDLPAIYAAHEYANAQGLNVRTKPDATYHLGRRSLTVKIATDTDWNSSRFTIDDTQVEDHKAPLFEVCSLLTPEHVHIDQLVRDQSRADVRPERDCYILVENDQKLRFIRRGANQNAGTAQQDCFVLYRDGTINGAIDWNYDTITRIEARPINKQPLFLRGGVFTTFANRTKRSPDCYYWARNIMITRSNTEVDGLTHYVVGETAIGTPYGGFIKASRCANITLRNCFATGHKIYSSIGSAGRPVNMGSYDYSAISVVNFRMVNCRMNHINDRTRWGVIGTNFCKNILIENCVLSRMDAHMGCSGTYTIRGCTLGHMGLNAIGRGTLTLEDSTLYGHSLVKLRPDYGSTWEGDLVIRNCRWIPICGETIWWPYIISASNDGMHDFGYPCYMPRQITIDGLFIDDINHADDYEGMYFFNDPDDLQHTGGHNDALPTERPFPYEKCQKLTVRGLSATSGRKPQISPNAEMQNDIIVIQEA